MASSDNLFDVVEELKQITADLRRTVYGDPATRSRGLMSEFDGLRMKVTALDDDMERVKKRVRPNPLSWTAGYVAFCGAVVMAISALLDQMIGRQLFGLPAAVATGLAVALAGLALVLFVIGFGWIGTDNR